MRIRKIELENLNSLVGPNLIDFTTPPLSQTGLIAITGETGAGKSTILDAILLALYGKTPREHQKEVVSTGRSGAWAEVEFEVSDQIYRARWEMKLKKKSAEPDTPSRNLYALINNQWEGIGSGKELKSNKSNLGQIEEITGLNYEQFCKSVILPQGAFADFLKAEEKDRAAVLERLTSTEIYGQISTAAYEKAELHRREYEALQHERTLLQLPTEDELREWQDQQKNAEHRLTEINAERNKIQSALQWFNKKTELEHVIEREHLALALIVERREQNAHDFARLATHLTASKYLPQLESLDKQQSELSILKGQIDDLTSELLVQNQINENLERLQKEAAALKTGIEAERQELAPILKKTLKIDEQIAQMTKQILPIKEEVDTLREKTQTVQKVYESLCTEKEQIEAQISESELWLSQNTHLERIAEDNTILSRVADQLREYYVANKDKTKAAEEANKTLAEYKKGIETEQNQVISHENSLKILREQLDLAFEKAEIKPEQLDSEITRLAALSFAIERVLEMQNRYQVTLREIDRLRSENESVLVEETVVWKELLNKLDQQDELNQVLELRKGLHEQQLWLQKLVEERAALSDGDACPLCGSTEHPYRIHAPEWLKATATDFERAQNHLKEVRKKLQELQNRAQTLHQKMGEVISESDQTVTDAVEKLFMRGYAEETKLLEMREAIFAEGAQKETELEFYPAQLKEIRQRLGDLTDLRNHADATQDAIRQTEQLLFLAKNNLLRLQGEESRLNELIKATQTAKEEKQREYDELIGKVNQLLAPYHFEFAEATFKETLEKMREMKKNHEKYKENIANSTANRIRVQADLKNAEQNRDGLKTDLQSKLKVLERSFADLQDKQKDRFDLFGDKSAEEAEQALHLKQSQAEEALKLANERSQEAKIKLSALQGSLKTTQANFVVDTKHYDQEENAFLQIIKVAGYADPAALRTQLLDPTKAEALALEKDRLAKEETEASIKKTEAQKALSQHQHKAPELQDLDGLLLQDKEMELELQDLQRSIGGTHQKLLEFEKQKAQFEKLQRRISEAEQVYRRWSRMQGIIGQKDGAKFRKFAQSLTLDNLIFHANRHLFKLFGRYRIQRKEQKQDDKNKDKDMLELEIVDTFQSDFVRSSKTLSGGESFLVSLALALGLSDLAGQKTKIQSVFIDEGFGTLDAQTLETAMEALENLQADGVTISVISHIPSMHERISTKVVVTKTGNGISKLHTESSHYVA